MAQVNIFAHQPSLRRKRRGIEPEEIKTQSVTAYFTFWFKSLILLTRASFKKKHRLLAALLAVPTMAFFSTAAMADVYTNQTDLQNALNAASPNGTVDIENTNLLLTSTLEIPAGVTLNSSTGTGILYADATSSYASIVPVTQLAMSRSYNPMIHVTGDGVTISNITIAGWTNPGDINIDGIYAEGNVTINNVTIQDIVDVKGTGTATAIMDPANATITNCTITKVTKNSIDFASTGTLIAANNTITGPGSDSTVAQNGIMVRGGTATLTNNNISGMVNNNTNESACVGSIGGTVTINGGSLTGCDNGVSADDSWSTQMGNTAPPVVTVSSTTTFSNNGQDTNSLGRSGITIRAAGTSVPTTSGGILVAIGLLLAGLATVALRRRRLS